MMALKLLEEKPTPNIDAHEPVLYIPESFEVLIDEYEHLSASELQRGQKLNAVLLGKMAGVLIDRAGQEGLGIFSSEVIRVAAPKEPRQMGMLVLACDIGLDERKIMRIRPFVASMSDSGSLYRPGAEYQTPDVLLRERQIGFLTLQNIK